MVIQPQVLATENQTTDPDKIVVLYYFTIWRFPEIGVPPKSSILKGLSIMNHPAIGVSPLMETMTWTIYIYICMNNYIYIYICIYIYISYLEMG